MAAANNSVADEQMQMDVLATLIARWRLIALSAVISTVLAAVVAWIMTPVYRAQVVFSVDSGEDQGALSSLLGEVGSFATLAGLGVNLGDDRREEALAVLRSREFTEKFITDGRLLPVIFNKRWDDTKKAWEDEDDTPTLWEANRVFKRKIRRIDEDKITGLVTLSIDWPDPDVASQWANTFVRQADDLLRKTDIAEADRSLKYLENEAAETSVVEVRQAIYRLAEDQIKRKMLARVRKDFAFRIIDPAAAPDEDDFVKPNRPALIIVGCLFGILLGGTVAVARAVRAKHRHLAAG